MENLLKPLFSITVLFLLLSFGYVNSQSIQVENPPICIESISNGTSTDGKFTACFNKDGIFTGGESCRQILKLRNLSSSVITSSNIDVNLSNFNGVLDGSCGIDDVSETGTDCNVSLNPKKAIYNPLGSFDTYASHSVYLGVRAAGLGNEPFNNSVITVNYMLDGKKYYGTLKKCTIHKNTANDLCYDKIESNACSIGEFISNPYMPFVNPDGCTCVAIGPFLTLGANCKEEIYYRNQSNSELTGVMTQITSNKFFDWHAFESCGVKDKDGNQLSGYSCSDSSTIDFGFMGMNGPFGGRSITYDPMPDFDQNASYSTFGQSLVSISTDFIRKLVNWLLNNKDADSQLHGSYIKDGKLYYGVIRPCGGNDSYLNGPFDAWDTFRDDPSHPPLDRHLGTKIVNAPFHLSLASLDRSGNSYEIKPGETGANVKVAIYQDGNLTPVSNVITFDANTTDHIHLSNPFTVSKAYSRAKVGFKFCATYEYTQDGTAYRLYPDENCQNDTISACDAFTSGSPQWHICYSSDLFAIRPKAFKVFGNNQYLRAGEDFNLTLKAVDGSNNSISSGTVNSIAGTQEYNAYLSNLNILSQFYTPTSLELQQMRAHTGRSNVSSCPHAGSFTIINPSDRFTNGEVNATLKFSETGILTLNVSERPGSEWAIVDASDTNSSQRYIEPATQILDRSDISKSDLMLFVPYSFETNSTYKATNGKKWLYMSNEINGTNKMAAYIHYYIKALNKDGNIVKNFTKTCFPDVDSNAPRVNGLKLNTTFDLFLDADLNTTADANITLYTEDNSSNQIWVFHPHYALTKGGNQIQEWISPFQFENGKGEALVFFNINRKINEPKDPVKIYVKDTNVSTSWMSNPGSPKAFVSVSTEDNKTFYYGRLKPSRFFYDDIMEDSTKTPVSIVVYSDDPTLMPHLQFKMTNDYKWYINTDHAVSTDGQVTLVSVDGNGSVNVPAGAWSSGINPDVNVSAAPGTSRPLIVDINLTGTDSWLIYNPEADAEPAPFYRVRFIGASGWTGHGKTGNVVESNASKMKMQRLNW